MNPKDMKEEVFPAKSAEREAREEPRLSARKEWFSRLELKDKEKTLFELEILLKGLDRFFNLENLPLADMEQVVTLNFIDELEIVFEFTDRVVELSGRLLEASRQEDYQFRHYLESKVLGDYERSRWREAVLAQERPEDSLFLLYSNFVNFRELIKGLLGLKHIPYSLFFNLGSLISRTLAANRFFNPALRVEFRPEFDRVKNRGIVRIIRSISESHLQRQVSTVVLAMNRLLQYLDFINPRSESLLELKRSLLFFALLRSESKYLMEFMENNLPAKLTQSKHPKAAAFGEVCDSLAFQLQMEMKKIVSGELLNLSKHRNLDAVKTAVENSHGILANFFQQSIVQLLQVFDPEVQGEMLFPVFISRRRQSVKLREDLAVLQALMHKFEEIIETTEAGTRLDTYLKYLLLQKGMIARMRKETLPIMRYQDIVEYEKYFRFIEELTLDDLHVMDKLEKFKMESKFFKILLETTLGHIENRAELKDTPLDQAKVEKRLKRFISEFKKGKT